MAEVPKPHPACSERDAPSAPDQRDVAAETTAAVAFTGINQRGDAVDGMGSAHHGGLNVALRDISVRFIGEYMQLSLWQTLLDGTATDRGF